MKNKLIAAIAVGASISLLGAACTSDESSNQASSEGTTTESAVAPGAEMTISEVVAADSEFATLLAAVKAARLGETLSTEGPFTVFAPTDDAFAALPKGTVETLLKPRNEDQLEAILTYHVLPDDVMAAEVRPGEVATVNGETFDVAVDAGMVAITDGQGNTADVTATDIDAANGVIHVIDSVLIPPRMN
jgi:uncharacterized surface protein with fasciclin (FAS1) repeats